MKFVTDDLTKWGFGLGRPLHAAEADNDLWELFSAITALQDHASTTVSIDYFTLVIDQFTIHMTDHSMRGPFTLPTAVWNFRDTWLPLTYYSKFDVFNNGVSLYIVLLAHTSAATFDPAANDGSGHSFYQLLLTQPLIVIPVETKTGATLTPGIADANTYMRLTNVGGCAVSIPSNASIPYPIGTELHFRDASESGAVTFSALSPAYFTAGPVGFLHQSYSPGSVVTCKKVDTDAWDIFGLLAVVP